MRVVDIIERCAQLAPRPDLSVTTNALGLARLAQPLADAGLAERCERLIDRSGVGSEVGVVLHGQRGFGGEVLDLDLVERRNAAVRPGPLSVVGMTK